MNSELDDSKNLNKESSENKYLILFDSIQEGLILIDEEGKFKECNTTFASMVGYTEEELKVMKYFDITPERWRINDRNLTKQVYEKGFSDEFEKEYLCKDGRIINVSIKAWLADKKWENLDIWFLVRNITAKKKLEDLLIKSEQKYRLLFDTINVSVAILDGETRNILDINKAALETFGYTKSELLKMKIDSLSLEPLATINILPEIITGKVKNVSIRWYQKKNGNPIPMAITLGSYLWQGKKIICAMLIDISSQLKEKIKQVNLITKIKQIYSDLNEFSDILTATNIVEKPPVSFLRYGITAKEQNIIPFIAQGLSNKEIAEKLNVAEITVKKHISSIFQKLKIKKRTELANFILKITNHSSDNTFHI